MRYLIAVVVAFVLAGSASAQTIGVNITAATGRMAPFIGAHRASIVPASGGQQFVAHIPAGDKFLTIAYDDLPGNSVPRQVIRVFLVEWRSGMNVTSSARLPLAGGTAATIAGGGNTTLVGMGAGVPDGGQITLVVTP